MDEGKDQRVLSVVMPCFNEVASLSTIVSKVLASPLVGQLIIVDDCSTDGSGALLDKLDHPRLCVLHHTVNRGKGAALRTGFAHASLPFVIVQDADLEYDPSEYSTMIRPLVEGKADVVYGSRFMGGAPHRVLYFWHYVGNKVLTTASNIMTNLNLSDMETCFKAFRLDALRRFSVEEDRFGVEPEITAKVARLGLTVYEVGISYSGRTYAEGKKIGWRDGFGALYCVLAYSPPGERLHVRSVVRSFTRRTRRRP